jgi:L-fucose mutarotase
MLKGIPGILPPDLLKFMMEMGHGDELVIADVTTGEKSGYANIIIKKGVVKQ